MPRYEYEISETGDVAGHAWELTLNGRHLARFSKLETALASARSLHRIDGRSGADPTVDVSTACGKFRVDWLDGASDSVQLNRIFEPSPHQLKRASRSAGSQQG